MTTLSKVCRRCNIEKPIDEFYVRSGQHNPTIQGHYVTECKPCMKERSQQSQQAGKSNRKLPRVKGEKLAIEAFKTNGIFAEPGKASHNADVDVVCLGDVWVEVKHAKLEKRGNHEGFTWDTSPKQQQRGFLAQIVMLICEYRDGSMGYHLFKSTDEVFYMKGRIKSGITFRLGATHALKHGNNRTVMTQAMMDAARDNYPLVFEIYNQKYGTGSSILSAASSDGDTAKLIELTAAVRRARMDLAQTDSQIMKTHNASNDQQRVDMFRRYTEFEQVLMKAESELVDYILRMVPETADRRKGSA